MQKTFIKGFVTKSASGSYRVLASSSSVDRQGDSIDQKGWDLGNFMKNPVMPWAHDYKALPIAKVTSIETTDKGLEAEFEFASAEGNPMAQQVKNLYDNGFLNAVSVGFIPKERNGSSITKQELLEISFVPVPANQDALRLAFKSMDDKDTEIKEALEMLKGAVSDELDAEEAMEMKCQKFNEVMEVIYALADVYFNEETPVEAFSSLLTEAIGLLQQTAGNDGEDADDIDEDQEASVTASFKELVAKKETTTEKFVKFFEMKSGAKLSKSTVDELNKAIEAAQTVQSVLEDLKKGASSQSEDGEDDTETDDEGDAEKGLVLNTEDLVFVRQALVGNDKVNELALSVVNAKMREMGLK